MPNTAPVFLRNASSFPGSVSQERTAGWMEGRVGGEKPERQDATQTGFMHESPMHFIELHTWFNAPLLQPKNSQ